MPAFGRGSLATALATAVAVVAPALAQENAVAGKPDPASAASVVLDGDVTPTITRQAGNYSEEHAAVGIAVAKGKKDEDGLTGERIGSVLSQALMKKYDVPSQYFLRDSAGDYTNITFFIKGRLYGPYSLGESVMALAVISRDFDRAHGPSFRRKAADVAGKPAPSQD